MSRKEIIVANLTPELTRLCEAVFDLSYDLGYAARDRGFVAADSRSQFEEVLIEALVFECDFDENEMDYLLEIGETGLKFIERMYETYGKED